MGEVTDVFAVAKHFVEVGAFALIVWLVRHTFTKTIPRLAREFRESLAEQAKMFIEMNETQRRDLLDAMNAMHNAQKDERVECMEKVALIRKELVILAKAVNAGVGLEP